MSEGAVLEDLLIPFLTAEEEKEITIEKLESDVQGKPPYTVLG